jgi:phosphatidylserine/phosphatidylglycerophosphate/cardiolipin synthase-like enzyme
MIRDGKRAFFGSQSLRRLELDARRDIGVMVTDASVVQRMREVFEEDWARTDSGKRAAKDVEPTAASAPGAASAVA